MRGGLYSQAEIARYFGCRPQAVARMIAEDALPTISVPGETKPVRKITLHGLRRWMADRHAGCEFMAPDELAAEIEAANAPEGSALGPEAIAMARAAAEAFYAVLVEQLRTKGGQLTA